LKTVLDRVVEGALPWRWRARAPPGPREGL